MDSEELRRALASYMDSRYPDDEEKLTMLYLRFRMFRELGETSLSSSMSRIESLAMNVKILILLLSSSDYIYDDEGNSRL